MLNENQKPSTRQRGVFLTFEGLDGCGKTTQIKLLARWLKSRLPEAGVLLTRQPGGTAIGDRIRALLLDSRTTGLHPAAELALFFADRAQTLAEVILPAVTEGKIVICDRFTDSTEAYQAGGRGLSSEMVLGLHRLVCGDVYPDLTILLMPSLEGSLGRARSRNGRHAKNSGAGDENRFESEQDAFHRRTRDKYREIAARDKDRVVLIEGDLSIREVHDRIVEVVTDRLRSVFGLVAA